MNALKAFVVVLCTFFFSFSASAASVVTVSVMPGQGVGLADPGYLWAGYIPLSIDGKGGFWGASDFITTSIYDPTWYNDPTPREMTLYTRSDILAGAPVVFAQTKNQYDTAAQFFLYGLLSVNTQDNRWGAGFDEMIWKTMWSGTPWYYASQVYNPPTTLVDVYNNLLPSFNQGYDFNSAVGVLVDPQNPDRELLVYMATPIPPAIWLFGGGLLGLVAVARRKTVVRV